MRPLLFLFILFSTPSWAQIPSANKVCQNALLEKMAILQNGRTKPLYAHARETLKRLTGKEKVAGLNATTAYCILSFSGLGLRPDFELKARVDHVELRKKLKMKESEKAISFETLQKVQRDLAITRQSIKKETPYRKALDKALAKTRLYTRITNGEDWQMSDRVSGEIKWIPFHSFLGQERITGLVGDPDGPILAAFKQANTYYEELEGTKHHLEHRFLKLKLPQVATLLTLLALALLGLLRPMWPGVGLAGLSAAVQIALMVFRVLISGRAPITNMYETVMFSGSGALILAMAIGHFKKDRFFLMAGLAYNLCTLLMMNFATEMLNDTIGPLVPVLRDNFWLSTHVTTIILSYGALALSWALANMAMITHAYRGMEKKELKRYADLIYTSLKYGTVLLGAGIILGGVWADYSWGRFWGWDPKETWSLIVFVLYMAILHGRYTSWIPNRRFIPLTALAFLSVMMAWFGVNYILASGLHSYGFSEGGAIFLGTFFAAQIIILVLTQAKIKMRPA